jgi:signal transduction histidine kinase
MGPDAGFGLGLSIAREAAAALGATLRLESTVGEGTTATIALPAARLVGAA